MADITPLVTTPSIAPKTASLQSGDNVVIAAEIQSVPDRFAQVTRPVQINGTVLSLQYDGQLIFHTASGNLALKLLAPQFSNKQLSDILTPLLQGQKPLNLAIQPGSPPTQALLTLPASAMQQGASVSALAAQAVLAQGKAGPVFTPGQILTAVVLPKGVAEAFAPVSQAAVETPAPAAQGLSAGIASSTAEAASGISQGGFFTLPQKWLQLAEFLKTPAEPAFAESLKSFLGEAPAGTEGTGTSAQTQTSGFSPSQLKPGMEWNVRLNTIIQPEVAAPMQDSPDQIAATVIGRGPDGQLLLKAGENSIFIRQNGNVPLGSKLIFTLLQPKTETEFLLEPSSGFGAPALERAMAALAEVEPMLAAQIMQRHIPQPGAGLPATLLFLFNAIQQGGVQGWLGEAATERFGKMNKLDLIASLADEMQQAGGMARDPVVGQWRAWPIPIFDGSQFQMLSLYVRRDRDRKQASAGYPVSPQTRFLINMNMSSLGPMQMDGLSQKKQLDLIVRSEQPLPFHLPDELRSLYLQNLEALGLVGSINFQTGRKNWIEVQKVKGTGSEGMVT